MSKVKLDIEIDALTLECLKEVTDYYSEFVGELASEKVNMNSALQLLVMEKFIEIKSKNLKS